MTKTKTPVLKMYNAIFASTYSVAFITVEAIDEDDAEEKACEVFKDEYGNKRYHDLEIELA